MTTGVSVRRQVLAAMLLVSALSGTALARPSGALGCGPGQTRLGSASCVHTKGDLYDARAQSLWAGSTPATARPICYGDGASGPRVQLIYGYVAGQKNRAPGVVPQIRGVFAARMQAMITAASAGKDLGIRFAFGAGCKALSVPVVAFPASTVQGPNGSTASAQFGKMITHLQKLGYSRTDRKYQVIWDWWNAAGVCGLGELAAGLDQPTPANVHNGVPTAGSHTDVPSVVGAQDLAPAPRYSAVWKNVFGPRGPGCWEFDQSGAGVEVHELMHTLGAVQLSAPHSDGAGHCTDTPSVMCTGGGARPSVPACAVQKVQVLDCGMDDFWNPNPAQGSYLSQADNIAASQFFGPQLQDRLTGSPL